MEIQNITAARKSAVAAHPLAEIRGAQWSW